MKLLGVNITMEKIYRPLLLLILTCGILLFSPPQPAQAFMTVNWSYAASQQYGTLEGQGLVFNNRLYFFGGYDALRPNDWVPTDRAYVYDPPPINQWTPIATMPYKATHAGVATDGTYIYLAAGYIMHPSGTRQAFATDEVVRYNPANNTYTDMPSLPQARGTGVLTYVNGELHFIGGANASRNDVNTHYVLSIVNGDTSWHTEDVVPNGTNHAGITAFNNKIYYFGGNHGMDGNAVPQDDMYVYDPIDDDWAQLADLPYGRNHISSSTIVIDGHIVVIGGETTFGNPIDDIIAYNPATNQWTELDPFPVNRHSGVAGVIDGYIYYTTGSGGSPGSNSTLRGQITLLNTPNASVNIEKTNLSGTIAPNSNATFEITVSNTGDGALTNVVVDDPLTADCDASFGIIAENASETYTCVASNVQQAFTNTATVTAQSDDGELTDSDSTQVNLLSARISLSMNATSPIYLGQGATFTLAVNNNGDLPLSNVVVNANHDECDKNIGNLAVGATHNYSCTIFNATQNVTVNATVNGSYNALNASDSETETVTVQTPSVLINVSPNTQTIVYEGTATFDVDVTNNGDVTLTEVNIDVIGAVDCYRDLTDFSVNETQSYTCSLANITNNIDLTFNAIGIYAPGTVPIEAEDTVSVTVNPPALPPKPVGLNTIADFQTAPVNPTFEWEHGLGTIWYHLFINGSNGTLLDEWYEVGNTIICAETCSINPSLNLTTNGNYSWWVHGWNAQGNGAWSDTATFTVAIPAPAKPMGLTTIGNLTSAPVIPTFQWDHDSHSNWYNIYISGANGIILNKWLQVGTNDVTCGESSCTVNPNLGFSNGNYSWWVRGWNAQGNGAWSDTATFTVAIPAPAKPTGLTTNGDLTALATPTFTWNNDSNSTWYQIYISGANGLILNRWYDVNNVATITCTPNICSISPNIGFGAGTYTWWVLGWNPQGSSAWSDTATFVVVQGSVIPTNLTVVGDVSDAPATPSFRFDRINSSTWYEFYLSTANGLILDQWYLVGGADIACDSTICTISPNLALPAGDYMWWVRGWNAQQGNLPWNNIAATFTVGD